MTGSRSINLRLLRIRIPDVRMLGCGLARHAEFVAAEDGEAFFCGHFLSVFGAVVVLQCPAAVGGSVGWAAVMGHAVPEEAPAGGEGDGDVSGYGDVCVTYLPVASPEMRDGSFAV